MKKKLLALLIMTALSFSLVACGGKDDEPAAKEEKVEVKEEKKEEAPAKEETKEEEEDAAVEEAAEESEGFSILDVSTDLVDTAIYSTDDDGAEYVITLFRDPDGQTYISMMIVPADGKGDIWCGPYDESCITQFEDEDGVVWTGFDITDVYTGEPYSIIFTEADDGSVAISNADFSVVMEGKYLSNDEAINYMGVAVNYID